MHVIYFIYLPLDLADTGADLKKTIHLNSHISISSIIN